MRRVGSGGKLQLDRRSGSPERRQLGEQSRTGPFWAFAAPMSRHLDHLVATVGRLARRAARAPRITFNHARLPVAGAAVGVLLAGALFGASLAWIADTGSSLLTANPAPANSVRPMPILAGEVLTVIAAAPAGSEHPQGEAAGYPGADRLAQPLTVPPPWRRHAVAVADLDGRPMVAIIIDDLGVNRRNSRRAIALRGPLTLAFLTYARRPERLIEAARAAGHELLLHVPMEPGSDLVDPGPNVLRSDLPPDELVRRLAWGLDRFDGYVGINNHMGSKFTVSPSAMARVMFELKARGLLFVDSLTAPDSVGARMARHLDVPYVERDLFLDNQPGVPYIHRQLARLEAVARARGYGVAIGHPYDSTIEVLGEWLASAEARGFAVVPVSAVVRYRREIAARPEVAG